MVPLSLFALALSLAHTVHGASYRLQSTTYAVTIKSSLASKTENCEKAFGGGARMLDFQIAKSDFTEDEFNEALTGVFFKSPTAAFFVSYGGNDVPAGEDGGHHYVLKEEATPNTKAIDTFGKAILESFPRQAQILCGVPMKEYQQPKAYKSPEEKGASGGIFGTKFLVILGIVGLALLARKKFIDYGAYAPLPTQQHFHRQGNPYEAPSSGADLQESLMTSVELQGSLSYNPAQQGMV